MTQVVNHKGKRLKVGPRGGGYHIYVHSGVQYNEIEGLGLNKENLMHNERITGVL